MEEMKNAKEEVEGGKKKVLTKMEVYLFQLLMNFNTKTKKKH